MNARDEAAAAMRDHHAHAGWHFCEDFFEDSLDAVPGDVFVRLAIDRGALVLHERRRRPSPVPGQAMVTEELYRLVTP